jgi:hypothetical protein
MSIALTYTTQQLTIYISYFIFIVGFPGNIFVTVVLSSTRNYRSKPCTFYCLILSIFNSIYLVIILIPYILLSNVGIGLVMMSSAFCKVRTLLVTTISLTTITLECLIIIDQFLVTSRNVHLRNWSTIKIARRLVCIIIFISILHSIPTYIYYDVIDSRPGKICDNTNSTSGMYFAWFSHLFSFTSIPISILIIFGILTYRNIRIVANRRQQYQYDRQFTKIVSLQICLILISVFPCTIYHIYQLSTKNIVKSSKQLQIESVLSNVVYVTTCIKYTVI